MKFTEVNPFNNKIQKAINKSILNTVKRKDFILGNNVLGVDLQLSLTNFPLTTKKKDSLLIGSENTNLASFLSTIKIQEEKKNNRIRLLVILSLILDNAKFHL